MCTCLPGRSSTKPSPETAPAPRGSSLLHAQRGRGEKNHHQLWGLDSWMWGPTASLARSRGAEPSPQGAGLAGTMPQRGTAPRRARKFCPRFKSHHGICFLLPALHQSLGKHSFFHVSPPHFCATKSKGFQVPKSRDQGPQNHPPHHNFLS